MGAVLMNDFRVESGPTISGYHREIKIVREADGETVREGSVFVAAEIVALMGEGAIDREATLLAERMMP